MKRKSSTWIGEDQVDFSISPPVGRRFNMDVDEIVLAQFGARAIEHAIRHLGEHVAMEHAGAIRSVVTTHLLNAEWVKPILEDELRQAARELVLSLWNTEEKQALRSWFGLLTAKARNNGDQE